MNQNSSLKMGDDYEKIDPKIVKEKKPPNVNANILYSPTCCRVCLNEGDVPIFHEDNLGDIAGAIFILTEIKVCPDDTLPKYLCHSCNETLQTALLFRQKAQESDALLKTELESSIIIKHTNKIKKEPENSLLIQHMNKEIKTEPENSMLLKHTKKGIKTEPENSILIKLTNKRIKTELENPVLKHTNKGIKTEPENSIITKHQTKGIKKKPRKKVLTKKMCEKYKNIFKSSVEAGVMFNCNKCSLEFSSSNDYGRHMLTDDHKNVPDMCPFCHREFKCIVTHLCCHKKYKTDLCTICGQSFLSVVFARHRESHIDDLPFKCSICPYRGRFAADLKVHLRSHTGEKPYKCSVCPKSFTNSSNLNRHIVIHKEANKFICDICLKGFHTQREFDNHQYTHSDVKLFSCEECSKSFSYKKALMKHTRRVHNREKLRSGRLPNYIRLQNAKTVE